LFNKLVGKRISITEDTPGVTRDRLYQEVEWQNRYFLLMDTGGLEMDTEDLIASHIEMQVDIAIESSSLILFLLDGKDGVTALDQMIAEKIRRSGKSCMMVVNKIDTHYAPDSIYEFYELGFSELLTISAEQSYGLGDLLDAVFEHLPDEPTNSLEEDALHICLIGKPNVGKSSLTNYLLNEDRMIVTDIPGTTRDSIDSYFERNGREYVVIDTAGLRRQRSITDQVERYSVLRTMSAIDRSEVCLFMIDATQGITDQDTHIAGYAHEAKKACIIVVNKWDLIEKETNTQSEYEKMLREKLAFLSYAPIVFISVKNGAKIDRLFETIDMVDNNYSFRIQTGTLNQVLRDATIMNPPPTDKGKRLKIFYASQVATRPPKIIFYVNDEKLFHFSYLRYMENQFRKNFDFTGVPLALEVREREEEA